MQELDENIQNEPSSGDKICEGEIILACDAMQKTLAMADKAAFSEVTVLLEGESGVGKEIFARYIHRKSARSARRFVPVHCAAIPETLFEAELFGYDRGAFTNAFVSHKGYFEQANGGTVFLDEISEIPLAFQVKMLRLLEEKQVVRLGSEKEIPIDVRIIAASQQHLWRLVQQNRFRHDLYYRVAVWTISIPPLRERKEDIELLARHFLRKHGVNGQEISSEAM